MTKRIAWVLFTWMSTMSCGGAPDAPPSPKASEEAQAVELTILPEVTIEGDGVAVSDALADARVTLDAPFLDVKAVTVPTSGGTATNLVVRTEDGWITVPVPLLEQWDDDPGCPSIERETTIVEVRVERGALVVVTTADRDSVLLERARACRLEAGEIECGAPETVSATRYWVDADGELEVDDATGADPE